MPPGLEEFYARVDCHPNTPRAQRYKAGDVAQVGKFALDRLIDLPLSSEIEGMQQSIKPLVNEDAKDAYTAEHQSENE